MKFAVHNSEDRSWPRFHADITRGFVCILDTRPARNGTKSGLIGRFLACAVLLLVALLAASWVASRPSIPLLFDDGAVQLSEWKSPTDFLLRHDFFPTLPN
ncbi:MAG: hypothetical protein ABI318_17100 [Chthoniobacteraceae bacterium]